MKRIIAAALDDADIPFVPDIPLDFYLPVQQIYIHVQPLDGSSRPVDLHDNVIVCKGRAAVNALAEWIRIGKR